MNTSDKMSPDASPGEVPKKSGVRRVNNWPIYIGLVAIGIFLILMMMVAIDRHQKQQSTTETKAEKTDHTSQFVDNLIGDEKEGIIAAEENSPPSIPPLINPKTSADTIAPEENLLAPPTLASYPEQQNTPMSHETAAQIRMAKLQQLEAAIKAKTSVQFAAPQSSGRLTSERDNLSAEPSREEVIARLASVRQQIDAQTSNNPTAAYQARLQQLHGAGSLPVTAIDSDNDYDKFANSGHGDRWQLDSKLSAPRSPYELRAGFVVPATLISGINSELPGQIMAQVSQDVYDTATGKWKLIPQGARLIGSYASDVVYGQSRVLIAWQRIVFPDGKALDMGAMPGADSAGYSGFSDRVNNHYFRLFSSALLMSGVTAGISLSQNQGNGNPIYGQQTASSAMSEALGQQLGEVTAQLIFKNMNISPTLEIRPGYRFNVIVTKDMTFAKPYQAFDY